MNQNCPACGEVAYGYVGHGNCLIVEDVPGLSIEKPIQSRYKRDFWTPKKIIQKELVRVDLDYADFRVGQLLLHAPIKGTSLATKTQNEKCAEFARTHFLDEAKNKQAILLIGADVCRHVLGYSVKDVGGLWMTSPIVSAQLIMAMPKLTLAYTDGWGEIRLTLERFSAALKTIQTNDRIKELGYD
jgi:hypothetical protein